jgi:hypothetical protein
VKRQRAPAGATTQSFIEFLSENNQLAPRGTL